MIRINLLPRQRRRRIVPEVGVVTVVVGVIIGLVAAYLYGQLQNEVLRVQIEAINHKIADIRPQAEEVLTLEARIERLRAKEDLLKSLEGRELPWADILVDLAQRTPRDVWLSVATLTSASPPQLVLQGSGFSYDAVARFMTNMASSRFYSDVDLNQAQASQGVGRQVVQFGLVLTLRPAPALITAQGGPR